MRTTELLIIAGLGALLVAPSSGRTAEKRVTGEPGGLFSLFTRGGEKPESTAEEPADEPSAESAPEELAPDAATAEPAPADEAPATESVAAPDAEKPVEEAEPPLAREPEPPTVPGTAAPAMTEEPAQAAPAEAATNEAPATEPPIDRAAPSAPEPAWPAASDSGGALAERPTAAPEPEATAAPGLADVAPEDETAEKSDTTTPLDSEEAKRSLSPSGEAETTDAESAASRELAAREIPAGGSVAPGAVSLPETEIQGELEKPDIFFLLPKARDQSDDQVIRARIRREITQPLVKEWLEEMMLLK